MTRCDSCSDISYRFLKVGVRVGGTLRLLISISNVVSWPKVKIDEYSRKKGMRRVDGVSKAKFQV